MNKFLLTALCASLMTLSCARKPADQTQSINANDATIVTEGKSKYEVREELKSSFTHKKGEGGVELVQPKTMGAEGRGTYCYFYIKNNKAISLRLCMQYFENVADLYELEVDGQVEAYKTNKTQTDGGSSRVVNGAGFQWVDKGVNLEDEEILRKIATAGTGTLRLKKEDGGAQISSITLTKEECVSLARTIDYYKSLNGAKIPKKGMVNIRG